MRIFAHRGLTYSQEPNSVMALIEAMDNNFDIELDLRDHNRKLVIEHDLPIGTLISADIIFQTLSTHRNFKNTFFALDLKANGLIDLVSDLIDKYNLRKRCFLFESTYRDLLYAKSEYNLPICAEISDLEYFPTGYADFLWYVEFQHEWIDKLRDKPTILCSPDVVGKSNDRGYELVNNHNFWGVCTDDPNYYRK